MKLHATLRIQTVELEKQLLTHWAHQYNISLEAFTAGHKPYFELADSHYLVPPAHNHCRSPICRSSTFPKASFTTFALRWSPLKNKSAPSSVSSPGDCHSSLLILRAMSTTLVLCCTTSFQIWYIRDQRVLIYVTISNII